MLSTLVALFILQEPEECYPNSVQADLKVVQNFLGSADEITTMVSDRTLDRDENVVKTRARLLKGLPGNKKALGQKSNCRISVLKGKDIRLAVQFFKELSKPPIQGPAKCFFPRHSLFARKAADWIEVQICYECVTMSITSKDGKLKQYTGINRNSRDLADKMFGYKSKNSKA